MKIELHALAWGAIVVGAVIGLIPLGDCGAPFLAADAYNDSEACGVYRAEHRAWPITLIGLGVAFLIGALLRRLEDSSRGLAVTPTARTPEHAP